MKHGSVVSVLSIALLLAAGACESPSTAPIDGLPDAGPVVSGGDGGAADLCVRPAEGCECDPDRPPLDCFFPAVQDDDGVTTCRQGTRYCRGGSWTACESVHTYTLQSGAGIAPLITGPNQCNACDPSCAYHLDAPDDIDIVGQSVDVQYNFDPFSPGIRLESGPLVPPLPAVDTDGDSIPDDIDNCVGPGAFTDGAGVCYGLDFVSESLPYTGQVAIASIDTTVVLDKFDFYFLTDTSTTMSEELALLQATLTAGGTGGSGILGDIQAIVPDSTFGIGSFSDYPNNINGMGPAVDMPYIHAIDLGTDLAAAQAALNGVTIGDGLDFPQSAYQALWAMVTGNGLGTHLAAQTGCPADTSGYPCFRDDALPVALLFTDAPFHNGIFSGPTPDYRYLATVADSFTTISGNDRWQDAEDIGELAGTWRGYDGTTCGESDNFSPSCGGAGGEEVLYAFTLAATTHVTISTEGSAVDTTLSLWQGTGSPTEVASTCNDDYVSSSTGSRLELDLPAGDYYVVVDDAASTPACGNYQLSIGEAPVLGSGALTGYPLDFNDAIGALFSSDVRVAVIQSSAGEVMGSIDAQIAAWVSGATTTAGAAVVASLPTDGSGMEAAVLGAVTDLTTDVGVELTVRAVDNPATTTVDERGFFDSVALTGSVSCTGTNTTIPSYTGCLPGASVDFDVRFYNDIVMPTGVIQVFTFYLEIVADGRVVQQRFPVRIEVPADLPVYSPTGSYWRDIDSTAFCGANERPDWSILAWAITDQPADTAVRWQLQSAATQAGLAAAPSAFVTVPSATSPIDIATTLGGAGISNFLPHLRVTAHLDSNAANSATPVLQAFYTVYYCVPVE